MACGSSFGNPDVDQRICGNDHIELSLNWPPLRKQVSESNLLCLRYHFGEGNSCGNTAPLLNLRLLKWSVFFSHFPSCGLFIILCLPFDPGHEKAKGIWLNQTETGELRPVKPFLLTVTSVYISRVSDGVCVRNRKSRKAYLLLYISSVCIFKNKIQT